VRGLARALLILDHAMPIRVGARVLAAAVLTVLLGGCSLTTGLLPTQPPGVAQQLVIRSLERALAALYVHRFEGRTVDVAVFAQAGNEAFVKEFVTTWLKAHGVRTVSTNPDLRLKLFATVLGTDRGETLIGLPSFQAPIVNVPFPEIALFKWSRHRGQAELRVFAFDGKTDDFVDQLPLGIGHSKSDDFTILLFIGFSRTDVDRPVQ
jgi:hypothetical protein